MALLILATGNSEPVGVAQAPCTVTVQPEQSIQKAIDSAAEGAIVCLTAGTWQENLTISKSLVLRGVGREQTKITGKEEYKPVIGIASESEIAVRIEGAPSLRLRGKVASSYLERPK